MTLNIRENKYFVDIILPKYPEEHLMKYSFFVDNYIKYESEKILAQKGVGNRTREEALKNDNVYCEQVRNILKIDENVPLKIISVLMSDLLRYRYTVYCNKETYIMAIRTMLLSIEIGIIDPIFVMKLDYLVDVIIPSNTNKEEQAFFLRRRERDFIKIEQTIVDYKKKHGEG